MNGDGLRALQQAFQAHVLHGDDAMLAQTAPARPSAAARLTIYAEGYRLRLLEVLRTDFPALHTLAGDAGFERLGRAYIDAHPSTHFSVRWFGRHLSEFLRACAPWNDTPVFAEMAALEWMLTMAFDAADDSVIGEADVASVAAERWPTLRLRYHASVQRDDFDWNVPELWTAIDQARPPEAPQRYPRRRAWVIWRRDLQNYFRALDDDEAWALDHLRGGANFASLCEGLCERVDPAQVSLLAAGYLKGWVRAGLVAQIAPE